MTNHLTIEFPPYQWIDIMLKKHITNIEPRRGWYVSGCGDWIDDSGRAGRMCETAEEASEMVEFLEKHTKWGSQIYRCWIHGNGERNYWTLR